MPGVAPAVRLKLAKEALKGAPDAARRMEGVIKDLRSGARKETDADIRAAISEFEAQEDLLASEAAKSSVVEDVKHLFDKGNESKRLKALIDPNMEPRPTTQTRTAEEYNRRLHSQLLNTEFGIARIDEAHPAGSVGLSRSEVVMSKLKNMQITRNMQRVLDRDSRFTSRLDNWMGDSPYVGPDGKPQLYFHVDRYADNTRLGESPIQFEDPSELGLHSGSNKAAESAGIGGRGLEGTIKVRGDLASLMEEVDTELGAVGRFEQTVGEAVTKHFEVRFQKGNTDFNPAGVWDEVDAALKEAGLSQQVVNKMLADMKVLPVPSTTPHYFRGKNGLVLRDAGGFYPPEVQKQLVEVFPNNEDEILALFDTDETVMTKSLQQFIESKGFDHVVYHNSVEDQSVLSIINWNKDLWVSPWDDALHRGDVRGAAGAAASVMMGAIFGEYDATVREEK